MKLHIQLYQFDKKKLFLCRYILIDMNLEWYLRSYECLKILTNITTSIKGNTLIMQCKEIYML